MGAPVNGIVEVAGPQQFRLDQFIRRGLEVRNDPRHVAVVAAYLSLPADVLTAHSEAVGSTSQPVAVESRSADPDDVERASGWLAR